MTDGSGHSADDIARCTKCNARLAVLERDVDPDEIPLCSECFEDEMPDSNQPLSPATEQSEETS